MKTSSLSPSSVGKQNGQFIGKELTPKCCLELNLPFDNSINNFFVKMLLYAKLLSCDV